MTIDDLAALALADTMLASEASLDSLIAATVRVFDQHLPWMPQLCEALLARTGDNFHYFSRGELALLILELAHADSDGDEDQGLPLRHRIDFPEVRRYCVHPPLPTPAPEWRAALDLPSLPTVGDLAQWLAEPVGAVEWFADKWRTADLVQPRLQHYHYRWVPKRSGGWRLIEIPKERLRRVQQKILHRILDLVPSHAAAHGFVRGRSCVTHARVHTGQRVVIRIDLKDFFPSVQHARIHALFEKLGYPTNVAGRLARICVNRTPAVIFRDAQVAGAVTWFQRRALKTPHLPQGSPCSPALANLCAYRLDIRLQALAQSMDAAYSRYADDLVFSGGPDLARAAERFHIQAASIALEEGFRVNTRKTRVMRQAMRQQVTGIVINRHANVGRAEYDLLKAILTNCARHGPATQNRDGRANLRDYLAGRVSYVMMVNPHRAARLQQLFQAIAWPPASH